MSAGLELYLDGFQLVLNWNSECMPVCYSCARWLEAVTSVRCSRARMPETQSGNCEGTSEDVQCDVVVVGGSVGDWARRIALNTAACDAKCSCQQRCLGCPMTVGFLNVKCCHCVGYTVIFISVRFRTDSTKNLRFRGTLCRDTQALGLHPC